ncbi:nitroreductase family deazaflavin-dependent oxidoreductase [Nocardia sp. NPDC055053]
MPSIFEPVRDSKIGPKVVRAWANTHSAVYRATGGRVGAAWPFHKHFPRRIPICLLTTTGRKTGIPRTKPTVYAMSGSDVVIAASYGGMPKDPLWVKNIKADPHVTVRRGKTETKMVARLAGPGERAAMWAKLVEVFPGFDDYQAAIEREIPVVVCSPADTSVAG